jgi:hypothetical protein
MGRAGSGSRIPVLVTGLCRAVRERVWRRAVVSSEHLDQAFLAWREEVARDEHGSLGLGRVVEVGDPDVCRLKEGITGSQGHDRIIGDLELDHAGEDPADDRAGVQVEAGRLSWGELDTRYLDALDHRLCVEGGLEQGLAHSG